MHNDRLVPLDSLPDFDVADGYTDIRGFDAYLSDGRQVGRVNELLVDPDARRVAAITLEGGGMSATGGRQVPIEDVEIDTPTRRVLIQGADAETLGGRAGATGMVGTAGAATGAMDADHARRDVNAGEERMTLSEEELELRKQRVSAGSVEVDKRVETQHVREAVPVMREEVSVERRPLAEPTTNPDARFEGGEIRVPLMEEEVVVEKRAVAKEELVISKGQVQETQTVEADLRRERAEIHERGDVRTSGDVRGDGGLRADNPLRGGRDLDGDGVR
ncbi:MAG TPA: PRC and DUF2382 domain-containing protein [Longimicrobium sp.]|nr:PRC and DUF2382 domain-containing protein [Longimicrobium sp.]